MRKVREILRLRNECGLGVRQIARSLSIAHSTVGDVLQRAQAAGLGWPLPTELDEAALWARLYPGNLGRPRTRPEPDWEYVHRELRRPGVTLQLLWLEYKKTHPGGYQYSRFCEGYRRWAAKLDVVLRQPYRGGERMMADFAGQTVPYVEPATGELRQARIFISVLPASNYTFCEGRPAEDLVSWIGAHVNALNFFGGVPAIWVCDQPRTAVSDPCRYEPDLNPTYHELAQHYGAVVIPARPRKPRDKAKVETAVQVVERWVLARLRNRTFFGLAELNQAVRELLEELNDRPLQGLEASRRQLFETLDRPNLKPLPYEPYVFASWKKARVNIDYHVQVDKNSYSVPYQLVKEEVDVRLTAATVEVIHKGRRVASHARSRGVGQYVTDPAHLPAAHRRHLEWTPGRLVGWAETVGPHTARLVSRILEERPHPEQGYRSCLGLMRLARHYSAERVEAAARRALALNGASYRSVKSILRHSLDSQPLELSNGQVTVMVPEHENVRGPAYYAQKER